MKKIIALFFPVMMIALFLSACRSPAAEYWCPDVQPNTKWISEDGTIEFTVSDVEYVEFGDIRGTLTADDQTVEFIVDFAIDGPMFLYPTEALDQDILSVNYEEWFCTYRPKRFVAVVEKTTFFEVGQEIVFYRVDE